jgi:TonB family protein
VIDPLAKTIATPDAAVVPNHTPAPAAVPSQKPKRRWPLVLAIVGCALLVPIVIAGVYIANRVSRARAIESYVQSEERSRATSQSRAAERLQSKFDGPPLYRCEDTNIADAGFGRNCSSDTVAFCDPQGRSVACCAKGLFPVGVDGVCACPPGGAAPEAPENCPRAKRLDSVAPDELKAVVGRNRRELRACLDRHKGGRVTGNVRFAVVVSPDGRVYSARIETSSLAAPGAQSCMLDVWRKMRFKPPGGTGGVRVSWPMEFASD